MTDKQRNPNQSPSVNARNNGEKVVTLKPNYAHAYLVNGKLNNIETTFLVDTGASAVVVSKKLAQKAGLPFGSQHYAQTANGRIKVYATRIEQINIGVITFNDVYANINPQDQTNRVLLGMSALKQIQFKYENNELLLIQ
jgi:aspartyl protease family protein